MHIAGDRDSWRGSLSPWVTIPSVSVRAFAVYAAGEPDETLPSKQAIRDAQQAFRANLGTLAAGAMSFMTDDGQVTLDDRGLFRLQVNGCAVVWIVGGAKHLQMRLMVCAHIKEVGHRGAVATWLPSSDCRNTVVGFARRSMSPSSSHSVSIAWILKRGRRCLVRLGRPCTAPGRAKSSISTISVGASGPLGDDGLDEGRGFRYILVMMDDVSNWVWLEPTGEFTA